MRSASILAVVLVPLLLCVTPAAAQDPGFALQFDGTTDMVRLDTTASMMQPTWPTTKTVSVWVNPTGSPSCSVPDPSSCDVIFGDRPRFWGISRGVVDGLDRIWIWNYDGTTDSVGVEYTAGEWIQVALVHENGVLSAYKNGAFVGSVLSGPTVEGTGQTLYFGGAITNASKNWTFEGEIDEVQIWNVARSPLEIAGSMSGPLTGAEPGLAAYYQMSDGVGTTLTDDTGHGFTGTLLDGWNSVPGNGPIAWVPSGAFGGGSSEPNLPPEANPQSVTTSEDLQVPITLSGSDPDEDPLTFRVTAQPAHGVLSGVAPDLVYTPTANYFGSDSFAFVANDGRVDSVPADVDLTVLPVNDPPVAVDDVATTAIDMTAAIPVLINDFDVDGDLLSVSEVTQPQHGTTSNEFAHVSYTPVTGFAGTDTFTYTIADGQGGFATATVSVTVTPSGADPGYALRFDGASDFVRLARTADIFGPGWETEKTVSLWLKPEGTPYCSLPQPEACDAIFGDRPRWWGIARGVVDGLDRIWVFNWDGQSQRIAVPYTAGEWMHLALVHGGGLLSAYKNGVLVGALPSGATQQPPGGFPVLHVGGIIINTTRNWTFQGEIDELQIWTVARTAEQIRQDMMWPLFGSEPGLAAYYSMSDGAGTLLTDDSGRGWTGTLYDGWSSVPADGPILWVPSGAFSVTPQ